MEMNAWVAPRKMCVSEFAAGDCLSREEQKRLLKTYRENGIRRWYSRNAGTKTCDDGVMFFSYYTCLCVVHNSAENNMIEFMPYVYAHDAFVNSRTTNRQMHKFLLDNHVNVSIAHIAEMYENLCNGLRVPCLCNTKGTSINIRFSPRQTYIKDSGIYYGDTTFKVPHVVMTNNCTECIGVYEVRN